MKMNILVTLNSGYIQPLTVMLNSLLSSNSNRDFRVFVAHSSLTREDFRYLEEHVPMDRCELVNIQVPHTMFADAPVLERLPKETYYRLFAAQLLPREVNRVLYLDPDLVVVHSIDQLYRLDFKGESVCGSVPSVRPDAMAQPHTASNAGGQQVYQRGRHADEPSAAARGAGCASRF